MLGSVRGGAAVHEIFGDFGLTVDHHRLAGQLFEREAVTCAVDTNLHALVDEAVGVHPSADAGLVQKIHRDLFDDAGAHAAQHVLRGLPFKDDVGNAVFVQQLPQQQAGRTGANNDDLSSHKRMVALLDDAGSEFRQTSTRAGYRKLDRTFATFGRAGVGPLLPPATVRCIQPTLISSAEFAACNHTRQSWEIHMRIVHFAGTLVLLSGLLLRSSQ